MTQVDVSYTLHLTTSAFLLHAVLLLDRHLSLPAAHSFLQPDFARLWCNMVSSSYRELHIELFLFLLLHFSHICHI